MIRALGKNVRIRPGEALTKHDFLLPLSDLLLDLVEQDPNSKHALWYSQRACSLAHDVVNMATMAGQLLWHTSVAPVHTGTPDSLFISMVAESYFVLARSACDVIAEVILELCVDPKKRGQWPKGDSFNDLLNWVIDNPTRVPDRLRFIAEHQDWFAGLRGIRDKLVHFGYDMNIYTDDVAPQFMLMSTGEITLHFLRAPRAPFPGASSPVPLMPFLKRITQGVLTLSGQVAGAISEARKHTSANRNVLNGVYIPALHHLLSYEELKDADMTPVGKQRREFAARYLLEAGDYLNAIRFGYRDGFWFQFAVHLAERYGKPPDYVSTPRCPPYRDGEELALWQLGFIHEGKDHTLILKDAAFLALEPVEGSKTEEERFQQLRSSPGLSAAVLVANAGSLSAPIPPEKMFAGLIIASDPIEGADAAFMALTAGATRSQPV